MTNKNKDKIIDRVIDFLHNKPLKSDMQISEALIEELKLVKNCSIPDVTQRSELLNAFFEYLDSLSPKEYDANSLTGHGENWLKSI